MDKIELEIIALSHSVTQSHNYAVILQERSGGTRRLPVVIGGYEAQSIAVAIERMSPARPLTHDLMKNTLDTFDVDVKEVVISNLLDGVFYAKLICERTGIEHEIDSRTSDAIAIAVRYGCPIFTYEFILEAAGIETETAEEGAPPARRRKGGAAAAKETGKGGLRQYSMDELQNFLNESLQNENYERAAEIRDEMKKRQEN
jgi:bifunctional DNase/RNase